MWDHGRLLQSAPQGFTQLRALRCLHGLKFAGKRWFQLIILQARKDLCHG